MPDRPSWLAVSTRMPGSFFLGSIAPDAKLRPTPCQADAYASTYWNE
jgi:hypothetical protein